MQLWLNSANIEQIKEAEKLGLLYGVTTNPSILAPEVAKDKDILNKILEAHEGPVAVQVTARDVAGMTQQGKQFFDASERIIVKIPVTKEGLDVIGCFAHLGIPVMATAVVNETQALLAASSGVEYIAVYYPRMEENGIDAKKVLERILKIFKHHPSTTQVLACVRTHEQLIECATLGVDAVTINENLWNELLNPPQITLDAIEEFAKSWEIVVKPSPIFAL